MKIQNGNIKARSLLFFLLLVVNYSIGYGQEQWAKFPIHNSKWSTYYYYVGGISDWLPTKTRHYTFEGDTIIDEIIYSKVISNMDTIPLGNNSLEIDKYAGAWRQYENIVTFIKPDQNIIDTIYNFSSNIGDTVAYAKDYGVTNCQNLECPFIILASIDSVILSDGIVRKRQNFDIQTSESTGGKSHSVIEGMGRTIGLLNNPTDILDLVFSVNANHKWRELLCFKNNETLLYTGSQYEGECNKFKPMNISDKTENIHTKILLYPNPTSDFLNIEINDLSVNKIEYRVYNLNGILVKIGILTQMNSRIDLSDKYNGVYLLELINGSSKTVNRIIKTD